MGALDFEDRFLGLEFENVGPCRDDVSFLDENLTHVGRFDVLAQVRNSEFNRHRVTHFR